MFIHYSFVICLITAVLCQTDPPVPVSDGLDINSAPISRITRNVFKKLVENDENVIYSPLSIAMALGMLLQGSDGLTKQELVNFLGMNQTIEEVDSIHENFKKIIKYFNKTDDNMKLKIANSILYDQQITVNDDYRNAIASNYRALIEPVDLQSNKQQVIEKVNNFVNETTDGDIPKLLDDLDSKTILLLLNVISFEGKWMNTFTPAIGTEMAFLGEKGPSMVKSMTQTATFEYIDYQPLNSIFLRLKYIGNTSMYIVMPNENSSISEVVELMSVSNIKEIRTLYKPTFINLRMPKFDFEQTLDLKALLLDLGLSSSFGPSPQLSRISDLPLAVSQAIHKAKIAVNEEGTKASAATLIGTFSRFGYAEQPLTLQINRPFFFMIKETTRHLPLFAGVVKNL